MRTWFVYGMLLLMKGLSRLFFRMESVWVGEVPEDDRWARLRVVAILHHTSLFEPIYSAGVPNRFLWRVAAHGVVPVARKTIDRPIVGTLFRVIAAHVVPISRHRDETWSEVLAKTEDPKAMVALLPEGRMMRRTGLDKDDKPMTVRGGIADILQGVEQGRMLIAYSGGLHHVQAPGQGLPRLFRTIRMRFEVVEIDRYRRELEADPKGFRQAVIEDLTRRRDTYCPIDDGPIELPRPVAPDR